MSDKNNKFESGSTEEFRAIRMKRQKAHASAHSGKKKKSAWKTILLVLVILVALALLAAGLTFVYHKYIYKPVSNDDFTPKPDNSVLVDDTGKPVPQSTLREGRYNFLAVGCDRKAWLSDVIMLATYDVGEKSVSIMQIPRDTYVTVTKKLILDDDGSISVSNFDGKSGYGCKINAVLGHGGNFAGTELKRLADAAKDKTNTEIDSLCKDSFLDVDRKTLTAYMNAKGSEKSDAEYKIKLKFAIKYLSTLLYRCYGFSADFYAQVNLDGFVDIVDAIGGVDVYVQNDMNYDDPYQDLHIHIKAGNQHLNGKDAEGFIRFRYGYAGADIARIDAQKIFMTAFIKKLMSIEGVSKLNDLVKEINANLNTNVSLSDALYFATNALDLDLTKVVMLTMPGTPAYINNVSYYLVNKTALMENINTYLNKYSEPLDESRFLVVQGTSKNTSREPLTATDIEEKQPDLGWLHSSKKTDAGSKNTGSTSGTSTSTEPTDASKPTVPDVPNHAQEQTEPTDDTSSEPPVVTPAQNQTGSVDSTPNPTEQTPASPNPTVSSDDTVPDKSTGNAENSENEPAGNPVISDMDDLLREYHAA
ncbi:MAG: LCP family protein [Eubacteriales bacterium]|jgi:LCP family protein required for cell wall assembly